MALSFKFDMMKRLGLLLIVVFSYSAYCQDYTPEICIPLNTSEENLTKLIQTIDDQKKTISSTDSPYRISLINRKKRSNEKDKYEVCFSKKIGFDNLASNGKIGVTQVKDVLTELDIIDKISLENSFLTRRLFFREF